MKRPQHKARICIAFAAIMFLAGCESQSVTQRWATTGELYATSLDVIVELHRAGKISDAEMLEIKPIRDTTGEALREWARAIDEDDSSSATISRTARAALDELIRWRIKAERRD